MQIIPSGFNGLVELVPTVYPDSRGWFFEFYKQSTFHSNGIRYEFVQENISQSKKNVVRGLHMQLPPHGQAKLVSVLQGKVFDAVVDLRKNSPTFGKVHTCILDGTKHNMLMIPDGFAHGFAAMEDSLFIYKSSGLYNPAAESGVIWNDPELAIPWPVENPVVSEKDSKLPSFRELLVKSVISPF